MSIHTCKAAKHTLKHTACIHSPTSLNSTRTSPRAAFNSGACCALHSYLSTLGAALCCTAARASVACTRAHVPVLKMHGLGASELAIQGTVSQDLSLTGIQLDGSQQQQQQQQLQQDGSERSDTPLLGSVRPEARGRAGPEGLRSSRLATGATHQTGAAATPAGGAGMRASTASFGYGYGSHAGGGGVRDSAGGGGPPSASGASAAFMPTPAAVMMGPQAGKAGGPERAGRPPRSGSSTAGEGGWQCTMRCVTSCTRL
eukprot:1159052-Pelagomonas_calceolata.AAC.14